MKWEKNLNSWWKVDYVVMIFDAPPLLSKGDLLILSCISLQLNVVFLLPLVEKKKTTVLWTLTFRIQTLILNAVLRESSVLREFLCYLLWIVKESPVSQKRDSIWPPSRTPTIFPPGVRVYCVAMATFYILNRLWKHEHFPVILILNCLIVINDTFIRPRCLYFQLYSNVTYFSII